MKISGLKCLVALQSLLGLAAAKDITEDTVSMGLVDLSIGGITIAPGVYWSIINNAMSVFTGDLRVGEGSGLYITSNLNVVALSVTLAGVVNSIINDGIISFNSASSLTAPTYNLIGLGFNNYGEMYLGGDGSVGSPMYLITAANWVNEGLLSIYQN